VAFLGIGHPLRRDDAAGVEICERLRPALRGRSDVLVVSGGSAPENCVGALRAFGPDLVVIVDAARMGQPPGTVLRIDPSDPRAAGASTHTLPLPVFCEYVAGTLDCEVTLLGIEPADTSFGEGLTPAVERAVAEAARRAADELGQGSETSEVPQTACDPRPHPVRAASPGGPPGRDGPLPLAKQPCGPLPGEASIQPGRSAARGRGRGWGQVGRPGWGDKERTQ
jgi:hydrogenase 3 maturation protease